LALRAVLEKDDPVEMTTRVPLREIMNALDLSVDDLAELAGVHPSTVTRALIPGNQFRTNEMSAQAIADALYLSVDQIEWANGVSTLGRPAKTGVTTQKTALRNVAACSIHFTILPATGICDECLP